jgi:hypothetical protein
MNAAGAAAPPWFCLTNIGNSNKNGCFELRRHPEMPESAQPLPHNFFSLR